VRWSPREETVLVSGGGDGAIKFWDIRQCTKPIMTLDATNGHAGQHTLLAHEASIIDLTFHPSNGLSLFSTGTLTRTRECIRTILFILIDVFTNALLIVVGVFVLKRLYLISQRPMEE